MALPLFIKRIQRILAIRKWKKEKEKAQSEETQSGEAQAGSPASGNNETISPSLIRVVVLISMVVALGGFLYVIFPSSPQPQPKDQQVSFTNLSDAINETVDIMPAFVNTITAIIPIIVTLSIVGFMTGVFSMIMSSIRRGL